MKTIFLQQFFKFFFLTTLISLCTNTFFTSAHAFYASSAGMQTYGIWDEETQEFITVAAWFPKRGDSGETKIDGYSVQAVRSTRIIPGFYPILLLSHDTASSRFANHDLAVELAKNGFIVIAPSHTGDTQQDSSHIYKARLFYDRPRQLLHALEAVLGSQELAPYADDSRIGLIGIGFGTITTLQMLGIPPDPSRLTAFCQVVPPDDPFCTPWVAQRISSLQNDFINLTQKYGKEALTPSIGAFAPILTAAAIPPNDDINTLVKKKTTPISRLMNALRGNNDKEKSGSLQVEENTEKNNIKKHIDTRYSIDDIFLRAEFMAISLYNAYESHEKLFIMPAPDHLFALFAEESQIEKTLPPRPTLEKTKTLPVFRRPATVREIKGATLLTPAGTILFSRESLQKTSIPMGIVVAKEDELYDPQYHAYPLQASLPYTPDQLIIPEADHFSLFAPCSQEMLESLRQSCGRLTAEARADAAQKRNAFFVQFFKKYLGDPEPVPIPSGWIAAPITPATPKATSVNATSPPFSAKKAPHQGSKKRRTR